MINSSSLRGQRAVRYLGGVAIALAVMAAFAGSPRKNTNARVDVDRLARTVESSDDNVTAMELADWIRSRRPNLRIVDVRDSADFENYHIPLAERIALTDLTSTSFKKDETIVLYSDGDGRAAQGWVFLRALGFTRVYFLHGGMYEWLDEVMNPTISPSASEVDQTRFDSISAISKYFGGSPRIGEPASRRPLTGTGRRSVRESVTRMRGRGC